MTWQSKLSKLAEDLLKKEGVKKKTQRRSMRCETDQLWKVLQKGIDELQLAKLVNNDIKALEAMFVMVMLVCKPKLCEPWKVTAEYVLSFQMNWSELTTENVKTKVPVLKDSSATDSKEEADAKQPPNDVLLPPFQRASKIVMVATMPLMKSFFPTLLNGIREISADPMPEVISEVTEECTRSNTMAVIVLSRGCLQDEHLLRVSQEIIVKRRLYCVLLHLSSDCAFPDPSMAPSWMRVVFNELAVEYLPDYWRSSMMEVLKRGNVIQSDDDDDDTPEGFDTFLSHQQQSAQKIATPLYLELRGSRPVFLDTQAKFKLHDLEKLIAKAATVTVIYNDEYFQSKWCLLELLWALRQKKPLLVVPASPNITVKSTLDDVKLLGDASQELQQRWASRWGSGMVVLPVWREARLTEFMSEYIKALGQPKFALQSVSRMVKKLHRNFQEALQMDESVRQGLAIYEPLEGLRYAPTGNLKEDLKDAVPLWGMMQDWLSSNADQQQQQRVLLVQGAAGSGKSLFSRYLAVEQWKKVSQNLGAVLTSDPHYVPLWISLPQAKTLLRDGETNLVWAWFRSNGFDETMMHSFQEKVKVLLILDGFDELMDKEHNLYQRCALEGWRGGRVVVLCRSQYLSIGDEERRYVYPSNQQHSHWSEHFVHFTKLYLMPFSDEHVSSFIGKYASQDVAAQEVGWSAEVYASMLAAQSSLQDMSREPFSLRLVLDILPMMRQLTDSKAMLTISRKEVYRLFVRRWATREYQRAATAEDVEGVSSAEYLEQMMYLFCEQVAKQMWVQETQILHTGSQGKYAMALLSEDDHTTTPRKGVDFGSMLKQLNMDAFLKSSKEQDRLLRFNPLRRVGASSFMFIHKSMQEYFCACGLLKEMKRGNEKGCSNQRVLTAADEAIVHFMADRVVEDRVQAIHQRRMKSAIIEGGSTTSDSVDGQVLHKMAGGRSIDSQLDQALLMLLWRSKTEEWLRGEGCMSSNAAMVLNCSRFSFARLDLSDVWLKNATLDHACLAETNLKNANLENAYLAKSNLTNTNLELANCRRVNFGMYPKIVGHKGWVTSVSFSPDGTRIASASHDKSVLIWELSSDKQLHQLTGHTNSVQSVAFSPDGTRIATGGEDRSVRIWDSSSGKQLQELTGHTGAVMSVAFSPDGTHIVSGSTDKSVRIWDSSSGNQLQQLIGHTDAVLSVAFSPDGTRIASGSSDFSVRTWDSSSGKQLQQLTAHTSKIYSVAFSPDGTRIASASNDTTVRIWDSSSGKQVQELTGHSGSVESVAFSPDGSHIVSGSNDKSVRIWDSSSGKQLQQLIGHTNSVQCVAFSPDGSRIASGASDSSFRIWDSFAGKQLQDLTGHTGGVSKVAFSPDGTRIASASGDRSVRIWDSLCGKQLQELTLEHNAVVTSMAFSPDGTHIASSCHHSVQIWDTASGKQLQELTGGTNWVSSVAFSPDGTRIVSDGSGYSVLIWDVSSGKQLHQLTGHTEPVLRALFSPDGTRIASASKDRSVRIWDSSSGKQLQRLTGHTGSVTSVAFSSDGTRIASAACDKSVRIWDPSSGKQLQQLIGHIDNVFGVAFSPDGTRIASVSWDRSVRLWDPSSGKQLQLLTGHALCVRSVTFSPDGTRLASSSDDKSVRIWDSAKEEFNGSQPTGDATEFYAALFIGQHMLHGKPVGFESAQHLSESNKKLFTQEE